MKREKIISLLIVFIIAINTSFSAGIDVDTTSSFAVIDSRVEQLLSDYDPSEILIVLDIDNTILTSSVDLGGDIWYQWQRGKLNLIPTKDQKVDCLFEDAIGLLNELGTKKLTDSIIPDLISGWQNKGISVFALTSRSPRTRAATEREIHRNNIDFSKTAIRPDGEELPVYRYKLEREISYMEGIMMTSGLNKGVMLDNILQKTGENFKTVVFVDDSEKNVNNMKDHFQNSNINFNIFYYNKIIKERKSANGGVILTKEQAEKMDSDWKKLNQTLKLIFPDRYKCNCLNSD